MQSCKIGGKRLVFHQGDTDGYSAYVSFMPDDGLGVVILTNQHATKFPDNVAAKIYEYLLTQPTTDQAVLARGLAQLAPVPSPAMAGGAALKLALDRIFQLANKHLSHADLPCYHDSNRIA